MIITRLLATWSLADLTVGDGDIGSLAPAMALRSIPSQFLILCRPCGVWRGGSNTDPKDLDICSAVATVKTCGRI